jgi:hypothetical protein
MGMDLWDMNRRVIGEIGSETLEMEALVAEVEFAQQRGAEVTSRGNRPVLTKQR